MKKILLFLFYVFFLPNVSIAASNVDAAVKDICECGFPPSGQCMKGLEKKYPEINNRPDLQKIVMNRAQTECVIGAKSNSAEDSIQNLVGNQNLDLSKLLGGSAEALDGINQVVEVTNDCSTESFTFSIPEGWSCRKERKDPTDVTAFNKGNKINVSLGPAQGRTSCSVIPVCSSEAFKLSDNFDSTLYKNPLAGSFEYAGTYKKDSQFKLTITSNTEPSKVQLGQISEILDSFKKR